MGILIKNKNFGGYPAEKPLANVPKIDYNPVLCTNRSALRLVIFDEKNYKEAIWLIMKALRKPG